ncbi:MAG TPA: PQQ-binding-like beta-propeller repeat protein [Candidatus Thermoplasmatota archaeon]|nr:PQQ-binding-like beta-propeller repeat protein [Candidatus Thermoplasmatota archaeon]
MKKWLAVGIILLFIGTAIIPSNGQKIDNIPLQQRRYQQASEYAYYTSYSLEERLEYEKRIPIILEHMDQLNPQSVCKNELHYESTQIRNPIQSSELLNSSWPMMSHDTRHTGTSPYIVPQKTDSVEKWRFYGSDFEGGACIDQQGRIYFGEYWCDYYALYPNGTLIWKLTDLSGAITTTPAIDQNGILYFGTIWGMPNYFYAVYASNGTIKWSYCTGNDVDSSAAIGADGTIYFGDWNGYVRAMNPNGTVKWQYKTNACVLSSPAIGPDGTVYCGSHDHNLYAFYPNNGTVKWSFLTGNWVRVGPCVEEDGTVHCVSLDGNLYAIYPNNGTMKWKIDVGAGTHPTIGPDGAIYAGDSSLYSVYPNGTIKWVYTPGNYRYIYGSTPAHTADGTTYFGTSNWDDQSHGYMIAVNSNGTERWEKHLGMWIESPTAIGPDGTLYIGDESYGGYMHAFGRGPLNINANGPYTGYYETVIQFGGTVYGGLPPYAYNWDFGDGFSSNQQSPSHNYTSVGNFTATFTVTDSEGNQSSDTARVSISYKLPSVSITKPKNGIYLLNIRVFWLPKRCITIGPITIKAQASQIPLGINHVEFSVDGSLKATDTDAPYVWTWMTPSFSKHTITVIAYDNSGKTIQASITVWKFF